MLFIHLFFSFMLSLICMNLAHAHPNDLTLFNWEHYLSNEVVDQFEQQTDINIDQVYFDDDSQRDRTINQASQDQLDLVVLDEVASRNFYQSGKIVDLSSFDLPFMANIPPLWKQQCTNAGVPYFWGTLGLAYRKDIYDTPPTSWNVILKPDEKTKGHILMMSDYTDMLMPSLFVSQKPLVSTTPQELKQVYSELLQLIPDVLDFDYVLSYFEEQHDKSDDVYIAMAYSGDEHVLNTMNDKYEWGFTTPTEGTVIWVDCLAILSSSDKQQQAIRFLSFLNQPEIVARNAQELGANPTNTKAYELLVNRSNSMYTSLPSGSQLQQATYYTDMINISVTLRNRISYAIIDAHTKFNDEK